MISKTNTANCDTFTKWKNFPFLKNILKYFFDEEIFWKLNLKFRGKVNLLKMTPLFKKTIKFTL